MNVVPGARGACRGFRAEDAVCRWTTTATYVFELAERTGAERLWHLRAGDEPIVVRAPEGAEAPARGARVA